MLQQDRALGNSKGRVHQLQMQSPYRGMQSLQRRIAGNPPGYFGNPVIDKIIHPSETAHYLQGHSPF